jgi:hypothetical protein
MTIDLIELSSRAQQYLDTHKAKAGCLDGARCDDILAARGIVDACNHIIHAQSFIRGELDPMVTR